MGVLLTPVFDSYLRNGAKTQSTVSNCCMRSCFIIAAMMALLVGECVSKVAPTTLQELADHADLIVIGKVTRVIDVKGIQVAEVQVRTTVKGKGLRHLTIYYLAHPTWICDTTSATVAEETLFFFNQYEFDPQPASMAFIRPAGRAGTYTVRNGPAPAGSFKEPLGFREQVNALVGTSHFWQVSWSGRGEMPVRNVQAKQYVTLWTGDVRLPASIPTIGGPERKYSAFIRSAPLSLVLDFVRRSLER
jgi:hypothetical protein